MAEQKTNAMRLLERQHIPYRLHTYDPCGGIDGVSVATKLGLPLEQVYKTLVTRGKSGSYYVFVLPVTGELDLKKAARAAREKSIAMIPVKEINAVTGYIRGGCSPMGMKKRLPTFIHDAAQSLDTVIVSAGKIGVQMELSPRALARAADGAFTPLVHSVRFT